MSTHANAHRKPNPVGKTLGRKAMRIGLFAASAAGIATAVPAQAATAAASSMGRSAAVAEDHTFSHADRAHPTQVKDSFTVRQFGTVKSAGIRNQANAVSVGCSVDAHCRSVALSFQIVTLAGQHTRLNAVNLSDAANQHCDGCQTLVAPTSSWSPPRVRSLWTVRRRAGSPTSTAGSTS
ncbi:hypothetical protein ACFQ51_33480 [Streptomyces kaempferi]